MFYDSSTGQIMFGCGYWMKWAKDINTIINVVARVRTAWLHDLGPRDRQKDSWGLCGFGSVSQSLAFLNWNLFLRSCCNFTLNPSISCSSRIDCFKVTTENREHKRQDSDCTNWLDRERTGLAAGTSGNSVSCVWELAGLTVTHLPRVCCLLA